MSSAELKSVTVRRSGGLLGRTSSSTVAAEELAEPLRAQLCQLAEAVPNEQEPFPSNVRDGFAYDILIETENATEQIHASEPAIAEPVRELIDFVEANAQSQP